MSKIKYSSLRCVVFSILAVSLALWPCGDRATSFARDANLTSVSIIHSNDTHGNIRKIADDGSASMLTMIAGVKRELANSGGEKITLLLDAGDITSYKTPNFEDVTSDMMAMDAAGYDAMTLGNHEIDFGIDAFAELSRKVKFPVLCASLLKKSDKSYVFRPYVVKQAGSLRIGIIGMTSGAILKNLKPEDAASTIFLDTAEASLKIISEVRKNSDVIILLSHLGLEDDRAMARAYPEIKLIVGAHSHTLIDKPEYIGKTCIVQAGKFAQNLGRIDVKFSGNEIKSVDYAIIGVKK